MIKDRNIASNANISLGKINFLWNATVDAQASTATLKNSDFWKVVTNTGAGAAIVLTLPAASTTKGLVMRVQITAAYQVSLSPVSTDNIFLGGSGVTNKDLIIAWVIWNYAIIISDGTSYIVTNYSWVLTKEA